MAAADAGARPPSAAGWACACLRSAAASCLLPCRLAAAAAGGGAAQHAEGERLIARDRRPPAIVVTPAASLGGADGLAAATPDEDGAAELPPLRPRNAEGLLPPRAAADSGKPTVVFDLDETLVQNRLGPGLMVERPHLRELLRGLSERCEMVLWTASTEEVAGPVLRQIDPSRRAFRHCIYRDERWFPGGDRPYTKDLALLGRDLRRTVIVENTSSCVELNPAHALMVDDFWGDGADESLDAVRRVVDDVVNAPQKSVPELLRASALLSPREAAWGRVLRYVSPPASAGATPAASPAAAARGLVALPQEPPTPLSAPPTDENGVPTPRRARGACGV